MTTTSLVPNAWAGVIIPMPFAAVALVLRLVARRMTRMGVGYDDGLSIAAWVFAVSYSSIVIVWLVNFKLGQEIGGLPAPEQSYILLKSNQILWASEFLYSTSIFLSKLAVLTFYRRIFRLLPARWAVLFLAALCTLWILLRTLVSFLRCSPLEFFWDKDVAGGRCYIDSPRYYFATDLTHTLLDVLILGLPIWEVSRMRLPTGQKMAVLGLFSCGFLVCIASAFQIVSSGGYDPNSVEVPYQLTLGMVWASVEVQLAVFASCLALLRPVFQKFIPGLSSGDAHSYDTNNPRHSFAIPHEPHQLQRRHSPTAAGGRSGDEDGDEEDAEEQFGAMSLEEALASGPPRQARRP